MLLWTSHICTVLNLLLPFMKIIYVLYFASSKIFYQVINVDLLFASKHVFFKKCL